MRRWPRSSASASKTSSKVGRAVSCPASVRRRTTSVAKVGSLKLAQSSRRRVPMSSVKSVTRRLPR